MTAAVLDDDVTPLRIVASAMAGRSVEVAAAAAGDRTWTDGTTVFLEPAEPRERLRLLGVQAALLAGDSLTPEIASELRRHRGLAAPYLAIEGHRALEAAEDFLPPGVRSIIDRTVAGRTSSPQQSLVLAREDRRIEAPWVFGSIEPRRLVRLAASAVESTTIPPVPVATEVRSLEELEEVDAGFDVGNLLTSPVGGGGAVGKLLARLLRSSRGRGDGGPPGADTPTHLSRNRPVGGRSHVASTASGAALEGLEPRERSRRSYPEWDVRLGAYRADWCQVVDDEPNGSEVSPPASPEAVALRRALAPLGRGLTPCRRQRQGEDIDIDAAVEARLDHLAGSPHEDDVYIESLRRRRDLSVLVLLDASGSAGEPGVGGRTVHDHQRDAAAALTQALFDLGDRVGLYAFHSRGRKEVHVARVKGFEERADGRVAQRLDGVRPGAYTRLGAAIRHGSWLLEERSGTPRRLLVVLSDGFAYDHGYEGRHGEADARRALAEARWRGIGCLCLSVGTDGRDHVALSRVFGTAAHATVPTTGHLPSMIGPLFAGALGSAEAKRRTHQRRERTRARLATDEEVR